MLIILFNYSHFHLIKKILSLFQDVMYVKMIKLRKLILGEPI